MTRLLKTAGSVILYGMIAASAVQASEQDLKVNEGQGVATALGPNVSAITFWVSRADGWHVVTTVNTRNAEGSEPNDHAVVRFSAVLQPGQSQSISIPVAIGERQPELLIRRVADRIEVLGNAELSD
ncbi:MAG: hypothetical protein AAAB35_19420 [Phyllobacterium sp.]|uniref:hypothetical protein n=1 Tax=Phyllobacterium sp. TaxID=1871046 RepID=UPI0030F2CB52